MAESARLGAKVRSLRRQRRISQAELAGVEVRSFAPEDEARRTADLNEVFGDALFEEHDVTTSDVREIAGNPAVSRAIVALYRAYRDSLESVQALAANLS